MNIVIEQMICDNDPELGGAVQLMGILRILLDPENMLASANKTEKTDFLNYFYKHSIHVLIGEYSFFYKHLNFPSSSHMTTNILTVLMFFLVL